MQVFKYYSYASNTEKGEVRSAFKAPGGYRKFPTGNFHPTGISGCERPPEKWLRTRKFLVLVPTGNFQPEILVEPEIPVWTGNLVPAGISGQIHASSKTAKDQSVSGPGGYRKFPSNRNFRFWQIRRRKTRRWPRQPEFPVQTWTGISGPDPALQRLVFGGAINTPPSSSRKLARPKSKDLHSWAHQKLDLSQFLQPNSLIFGGLKEKAPIYNFTKPFFISPSFTWGIWA